jgi:hypothetical protein
MMATLDSLILGAGRSGPVVLGVRAMPALNFSFRMMEMLLSTLMVKRSGVPIRRKPQKLLLPPHLVFLLLSQ